MNRRASRAWILLLALFPALPAAFGTAWAGGARSLSLRYDFADLAVNEGGGAAQLGIAGCSQHRSVGEPVLPFRTAMVPLPPGNTGAKIRTQNVGNTRFLMLKSPVEFGRTPILFGPDRLRALAPAARDKADSRTYGSGDPPVLTLAETADSKFVRPGETVTVKLNVSGLAGREINSIQALLQFDNTRLTNPSITKSSLSPWNAGLEPLKTISGDKIDYSIGITGSTSADAEIAVLTFTAGTTEGSAFVRFRPDEPPKYTKVVQTDLVDLLPSKIDAGPIVVDGTPPVVVLKSPVGGEFILGGGSCAITWTTTDANPDTVTIEYTTNNGTTWTVLRDWAAAEPDDGSYTWAVPNVNSDQCKVRVTAKDLAGNQSASDASDTNFTIDSTAPVVTVAAPNGGQYLKGGSSATIT